METIKLEEAPALLPSSLQTQAFVDDVVSDPTHSNTASVCNSIYGSDGIFDRHPLRSPVNGSESEYEDEDDLISEMPIDSHAPSCCGEEPQEREAHNFIEYTPGRRSPFRNPSSVRGMQLEITPPHMRSALRDSMKKARGRLSIGSRNSTPRSIRSYRSGSPVKNRLATKSETPLVLLHVTILPISCPYSLNALQDVAPPHILQNWKLLREKVPETVLERGILIPHPREEYDLLEERLLESLELALPRILKCGHFHRDATDDEESDDADCQSGSQTSHKSGDGSDDDPDVCTDCLRHVRDGSRGSSGTGKRRWNIRFYAANGLMRAGAWSAAWKEMERVDVEISPWMDDDLRRQLELRRIEEQQEHGRELSENHQDEHEYLPNMEFSPSNMDEARRREIYGDALPSILRRERIFTPGEIVEAYEHGPVHDPTQDVLEPSDLSFHEQNIISAAAQNPEFKSAAPRARDIPVTELLQNYAKLLLQDQRNVALALLSVIVVWLALRPSPIVPQQQLQHQLTLTTPDPVHGSLMSTISESPLSSLGSIGEELSSTVVENVLAELLLPTSVADVIYEDQHGSTDPPLDLTPSE